MSTLSISLPDALKKFVEDQVAAGDYSTPSDYVGALIEDARMRAARQAIDDRLLQALESGPTTPMTRADWDDLEQRVRDRESRSHAG